MTLDNKDAVQFGCQWYVNTFQLPTFQLPLNFNSIKANAIWNRIDFESWTFQHHFHTLCFLIVSEELEWVLKNWDAFVKMNYAATSIWLCSSLLKLVQVVMLAHGITNPSCLVLNKMVIESKDRPSVYLSDSLAWLGAGSSS